MPRTKLGRTYYKSFHQLSKRQQVLRVKKALAKKSQPNESGSATHTVIGEVGISKNSDKPYEGLLDDAPIEFDQQLSKEESSSESSIDSSSEEFSSDSSSAENVPVTPLPCLAESIPTLTPPPKKMNPPKRSYTPSFGPSTPKRMREILHADNSLNILHVVSEIRSTTDKIYVNTQINLQHIIDIKQEMSDLKEAVYNLMSTYKMKLPFTFSPADTNEQLAVTVQAFQDFEGLAKKIESADLRSTIRRFIKAFMTKELAQQYSWTGLGSARKKTKKSFKDSILYSVLKNVLPYTSHKHASFQSVGTCIGIILSQAGDWEMGRRYRNKPKTGSWQPKKGPKGLEYGHYTS